MISLRNNTYAMTCMMDQPGITTQRHAETDAVRVPERSLHPAWLAFINYCKELDHGEIEILKIQNGLPVIGEVVRKKVKFA